MKLHLCMSVYFHKTQVRSVHQFSVVHLCTIESNCSIVTQSKITTWRSFIRDSSKQEIYGYFLLEYIDLQLYKE